MMRFWWRFFAGCLIAYAGYTIWLSGAYRETEPFAAGQCLAVDAPPGPEDLAILPDGSGAIVSSQDRRDGAARGGLYFYDMASRPGRFVPLATPPDMPLHPHGLSLHRAADGALTLQVINHRSRERHSVELFAVEPQAGGPPLLRHRGSVTSGLFVHPNGIAAAGPDSFYLTNDRGSGPGWMHALETLLQVARSTVIYYDGSQARQVADEIVFANGIELAADGGSVLVASTVWRMVLAYSRDPATGGLVRTGSLPLPGGADNIKRDAAGDLWVAAHPNAFAFIGHAMNPDKESPGVALRIARDGRGAVHAMQAFGDPGTLISGTSVAAHHAGRLLVGAVFQPRLLDCRIDAGQLRPVD